MVRLSNEDDKKYLKRLYNSVFRDEESFCDRFFRKIWKPENTLLIEENRTVISGVHMIPVTIKDKPSGSKLDCTYIYAAATLPEFRGRGYMSTLLEESFKISTQRDVDFSVLIVAEESLFEYYQRFGFERFFNVEKKDVPCVGSEKYFVRPAQKSDYAEMVRIYNHYTYHFFSVLRTERDYELLSYLYDQEFYLLVDESGRILSYCIGTKENNIFYATEAMGKKNECLVSAIAKMQDCSSGCFHTIPNEKSKKNIGAIKPLNSFAFRFLEEKENIFINLLYN